MLMLCVYSKVGEECINAIFVFVICFPPLKHINAVFQWNKSGKCMRIYRNNLNEAEFSYFQKLIQRGWINLAIIFFKKIIIIITLTCSKDRDISHSAFN